MTTSVVGVVGAGQLARMMQQAAIGLDVHVRVLATDRGESAARICPDVVVGKVEETLVAFAETCDVTTFDHELVDPTTLAATARAGHVLRPSPQALRFAQDKGHQRDAFASAGLPLPAYVLAGDTEQALAFARRWGWPIVVKAPRGGYDGRGVEVADGRDQLDAAWVGLGGGPLLIEEHVALEAELAVLIARRPSGATVTYPVVGTVQTQGILTELTVPAHVPSEVIDNAREVALAAAEVVGAVGMLAVELLWDGTRVLVNEVATRPHNSGHWTIEGAVTSQFANHLRAVLDWPLGDPGLTATAVSTVNILGPQDGSDPRDRRVDALSVPGVAVHLYGKGARPGRKLGHVTALGAEAAQVRARAHRCATLLTGAKHG